MKTIPIPSLSKVPFDVNDKGEVLGGRGKIPIIWFKDHHDGFDTRYRDWLAIKGTPCPMANIIAQVRRLYGDD